MRLEDLKLSYGYPLQLQTANAAGQPERYSCLLIGCLPDRSILVSVPKSGGRLLRFRTGQKVVFRFMIDNGVGVFISSVELQTADPYPILHIAYPDTINFKGIRSAARVSVDLMAQVSNNSQPGAEPKAGRIVDMSVTGLRIETEQSCGEIGQQLNIRAEVDVNGLQRRLELSGVIRSQVDSAEGAEGGSGESYGIEFDDNSEDQRLLLYAFVYGQILAQDSSVNHWS